MISGKQVTRKLIVSTSSSCSCLIGEMPHNSSKSFIHLPRTHSVNFNLSEEVNKTSIIKSTQYNDLLNPTRNMRIVFALVH